MGNTLKLHNGFTLIGAELLGITGEICPGITTC